MFSTTVTSGQDDVSSDPQLKAEENKVCLTKDCIAASHRIFEYMDQTANPCEDFDQFACGGFKKNKVIPDDKSDWDVFDILTKKIEYNGRQLLEEPIDDKNDFESYKKAKKFYKSCINEDAINDKGLEPLRKILNEIGGWPVLEGEKWNGDDFNVWDMSIKFLSMGYSNDYIASAYIYADAKNNTNRVLYMDQADLGLSKEYWAKGMNETEVQAYFQ